MPIFAETLNLLSKCRELMKDENLTDEEKQKRIAIVDLCLDICIDYSNGEFDFEI